jgi:hypothetical protein
MQCQACSAPQQHVARRHCISARVCSERCGRQLLAGICPASDAGHIHVSAASPIGCVIAINTGLQRNSYTLPVAIVDRISASMQRIGPQQKRAADAAELDESTQAAAPAPVPPQPEWMTQLPIELWQEVTKLLTPGDIGALGATSRRAAARMRDKYIQGDMIRRNMSARDAVYRYMSKKTPESQRKLIRDAYPFIAEMCVAATIQLAQTLDNDDAVYSKYVARFHKYRQEAGLAGRALFTRPIHAAAWRGGQKINPVFKVMVAGLCWFSRLKSYYFGSETSIISFGADESDDDLLETPETVCFFAIPLLHAESASTYHSNYNHLSMSPYWNTFSIEWFRRRGVDTTRHNFYTWLCTAFYSDEALRHIRPIKTFIRTTPELTFPVPSKRGEISALLLNALVGSYDRKYLYKLMVRTDQFHDNIMAPAEFDDPNKESILFKLMDKHLFVSYSQSPIRFLFNFILLPSVMAPFEAQSLPDPLSVRNWRNQTPIESLLLHTSRDDFFTHTLDPLAGAVDSNRLQLLASSWANPSIQIIATFSRDIQIEWHERLWIHLDPIPTEGMRYFSYLVERILHEPMDTKLEFADVLESFLSVFRIPTEHFPRALYEWNQLFSTFEQFSQIWRSEHVKRIAEMFTTRAKTAETY